MSFAESHYRNIDIHLRCCTLCSATTMAHASTRSIKGSKQLEPTGFGLGENTGRGNRIGKRRKSIVRARLLEDDWLKITHAFFDFLRLPYDKLALGLTAVTMTSGERLCAWICIKPARSAYVVNSAAVETRGI